MLQNITVKNFVTNVLDLITDKVFFFEKETTCDTSFLKLHNMCLDWKSFAFNILNNNS